MGRRRRRNTNPQTTATTTDQVEDQSVLDEGEEEEDETMTDETSQTETVTAPTVTVVEAPAEAAVTPITLSGVSMAETVATTSTAVADVVTPAVAIADGTAAPIASADPALRGQTVTHTIADEIGFTTPIEAIAVAVATIQDPPITDPVIPVKKSLAAGVIGGFLEQYVALASRDVLNDAAIAELGRLLHRASKHLVDRLDEQAFEVVWAFHVAHKDDLMTETKALRGVFQLDRSAADFTANLYHIFRVHVLREGTYDAQKVLQMLGGKNDLLTLLRGKYKLRK